MVMVHEVLNAVLTARAAVVVAAPTGAPAGPAPTLRIAAIHATLQSGGSRQSHATLQRFGSRQSHATLQRCA